VKLTWARQQVGMWVAFDEKGNAVGYVFNRGGGHWSAQAANGYEVCETSGKAKAAVRKALEAWLARDKEIP